MVRDSIVWSFILDLDLFRGLIVEKFTLKTSRNRLFIDVRPLIKHDQVKHPSNHLLHRSTENRLFSLPTQGRLDRLQYRFHLLPDDLVKWVQSI